ncbi:zinc finger CCCH-type with G patch domain-containing protein-like [Acanthaster planci]|uniref:Zinc finger CCCH-type with G patch domain-containing protein n=1 Tax=Acanthaster planci TaxID=133434 RepID=A0A8B7ZWN0_ACAPL|nr:zinc finger CCCH-type with G patch domain-containing protein-like [Acanthaster planci]
MSCGLYLTQIINFKVNTHHNSQIHYTLMDEETLQTSISAYKQQLQQVETVLLSAGAEGQTELLQLREDLQQVIQLTEESLLSLKKSKLLSLVDGTSSAETSSSFVNPASSSGDAQVQQGHSSASGSSSGKFEEEYAAFQAALADEEETVAPPQSSNASSSTGSISQWSKEITNAEVGEDDSGGEEEDDICGTKCSVDYMEEWGGRQRHNAVVLCVEPRNSLKEEASLRVLFCNPTSKSMRPCPYFLEGTCRFTTEDCRFSHGYVVKLSELHAFKEPDFSLLKLEAPCLARYSDGIWYPASIQHIDQDKHQVAVQFESYGTTETLDIESILPSEQREESSPSLSSSSDDDYDNEEDKANLPSTSYSRSVEQQEEKEEDEGDFPRIAWRPSGDGIPLGEWEAHTRGIGSMLMAKMGYEFGKGLGRNGEGRVEPVEAVIIPQGKSLDKCMELREMKKLGIVGKPKKKKGKGKGHHHSQGGSSSSSGQHREKENVFDFINRKLGGKKTKITELIQQNSNNRNFQGKDPSKDKQEKPGRKLNIQLVRTEEDIRSTEKQLMRLQESLQRNQRDKLTASKIKEKIDATERLLQNLKSYESKIKRQQNNREEHRKLTVF